MNLYYVQILAKYWQNCIDDHFMPILLINVINILTKTLTCTKNISRTMSRKLFVRFGSNLSLLFSLLSTARPAKILHSFQAYLLQDSYIFVFQSNHAYHDNFEIAHAQF